MAKKEIFQCISLHQACTMSTHNAGSQENYISRTANNPWDKPKLIQIHFCWAQPLHQKLFSNEWGLHSSNIYSVHTYLSVQLNNHSLSTSTLWASICEQCKNI